MGCFWVEPWLPARAIHRFTVTIWASLTLTVTSCGAGHPLVDQKLISWLMKKWKVLFKTYLRMITQEPQKALRILLLVRSQGTVIEVFLRQRCTLDVYLPFLLTTPYLCHIPA